jgi:hypothetical protein
MPPRAACDRKVVRQNLRIAKTLYPQLSHLQLSVLHDLTVTLRLSKCRSELLFLSGKWYVSPATNCAPKEVPGDRRGS